MMDKEQILASGLLEQYVLGLTTPEENLEVEAYAEAYPEIKAEIENMQKAVEQYALQYSIPPAQNLKQDIMSEIDELSDKLSPKQVPANARPASTWLLSALAACVALLLFASLRLYKDNRSLDDKFNVVNAEYATFKENCERQKASHQETLQLFAVLKDNQTIPVRLGGTDLAPEAQAVVYWNQNSELAYLNVINLPKPPKGKQYQIWADVKGEMIDMGVFDGENTDLQSVNFIANAESFNITLEPMGGSKHPTVELLHANGKV